MATLTYAIGDVHGSYTKLANLMRHCRDHCGNNVARFVLLGDYVDRGRRSRDVVNLLIEAQAANPDNVVCLKGNHEDMLLDAAGGDGENLWLDNGGYTTLHSYGVTHAADIPASHLAWFRNLPLAISDEKRFFVHAGVIPGVPLQQQSKAAMLWVRDKFLSDQRDHGLYVVHGHTPNPEGRPEVRHNRLNLDTYAWNGNPLFAAVFDERRVGPLAFVADDGTISAAPAINALEQDRYGSGHRARAR